jgi:hypothetical protein
MVTIYDYGSRLVEGSSVSLRPDPRWVGKKAKRGESARKAINPQPIPYAFVVGLKAPNVGDLYDRVVRAYANILVALQPRLRIQTPS